MLIASSGDAGAHLTEAAVEALRSLGADVQLDELRNAYFAIVGVQGAAQAARSSLSIRTRPSCALASTETGAPWPRPWTG